MCMLIRASSGQLRTPYIRGWACRVLPWCGALLGTGHLQGKATKQRITPTRHDLQAQHFHIMGWHWGGIVAFNTARAWPQRVLRLVLAAPPISDPAIIRFASFTLGFSVISCEMTP